MVMAIGMTGALGIALVYLGKQQMNIQKKTKIYFELNNLSNKILRGLYDGDGCMKTLGAGSDIVDGETLSAIKDKDGKVVVDTTKAYGNKLIKIDSINLANVNIVGKGGQVDLEVVFKKLGRFAKGHKKTVQFYPLSVVVDGFKRLTQCHYDYGNIIFVTAQGICKSLGGIFDAVTLQCSLEKLALNMEMETCKNLGSNFNNATKTCMIDNVIREVHKKSCKGMGGTFKASSGECVNIRR